MDPTKISMAAVPSLREQCVKCIFENWDSAIGDDPKRQKAIQHFFAARQLSDEIAHAILNEAEWTRPASYMSRKRKDCIFYAFQLLSSYWPKSLDISGVSYILSDTQKLELFKTYGDKLEHLCIDGERADNKFEDTALLTHARMLCTNLSHIELVGSLPPAFNDRINYSRDSWSPFIKFRADKRFKRIYPFRDSVDETTARTVTTLTLRDCSSLNSYQACGLRQAFPGLQELRVHGEMGAHGVGNIGLIAQKIPEVLLEPEDYIVASLRIHKLVLSQFPEAESFELKEALAGFSELRQLELKDCWYATYSVLQSVLVQNPNLRTIRIEDCPLVSDTVAARLVANFDGLAVEKGP